MQATKNLICQQPAGVSVHLINGQELEVVQSSKRLGVTVNLSSIIQSTHLFLYADQTQAKADFQLGRRQTNITNE